MNTEEFERILDVVVEQLGQEVRASKAHHAPDAFQRRVLEVLKEVAKTEKLEVDPSVEALVLIVGGVAPERLLEVAQREGWEIILPPACVPREVSVPLSRLLAAPLRVVRPA